MEDKTQDIANRIKLARERSGLSQGQVSIKLGINKLNISEIEAGEIKVDLNELIMFSKLFKVNLYWLCCQDETYDKTKIIINELKHLKSADLEEIIDLIKSLKLD